MSQYGSWRQPRCLVNDGGDGSIGINGETLEALSHVNDPLDVVCILGGYRTGKSYLMNRLATATPTAHTDAGTQIYLCRCQRPVQTFHFISFQVYSIFHV